MIAPCRPNPLKQWFLGGLARFSVPAGARPAVLLTFDDGPTPAVTPRILDRLEAHQARAVFFVLGGKAERNPALLQDIAARGHLVGNHSFSHITAAFPDPAAYLRDVKDCSRVVAAATGELPRLFRAPEGRIHPGSIFAPAILRMHHVLWSLDTNDWRLQSSQEARETAELVLDQIRPGDVVLMHDFDVYTVDLLDRVLPELVRRDFDLSGSLEILKRTA